MSGNVLSTFYVFIHLRLTSTLRGRLIIVIFIDGRYEAQKEKFTSPSNRARQWWYQDYGQGNPALPRPCWLLGEVSYEGYKTHIVSAQLQAGDLCLGRLSMFSSAFKVQGSM